MPATTAQLDHYIRRVEGAGVLAGYVVEYRDEDNGEHVADFDTIIEARDFVRTELLNEPLPGWNDPAPF